jgi:hypothetical protein
MDVYVEIAKKIIKKQEDLIGPIAVEQAEQVPNLKIDWKANNVSINGNGPEVIDNLVQQYRNLFGQISIEVSKEAARPYISQLPPEQIPSLLK